MCVEMMFRLRTYDKGNRQLYVMQFEIMYAVLNFSYE